MRLSASMLDLSLLILWSHSLCMLTGAQFLHGRSWRGLEQKLGETEITNPVEGRTGLPVSYSHEHKHDTRTQ